MKQIKHWLVTITMLLCSLAASAHDFEVDGIRYDITSFTDLTVKASSISETLIGELLIPSKVQFNGRELIVTEIGDEFAVSNVAISSLTIDEGISSIGNRAFKNCSNLATINIAQTVTQLGTECFYGCTSLNAFDNKGIASLGSNSFAECGNLKEVSIENLASLAEGTFLNCTKLSDCNLPNITSIEKEAFKNCQSLKEYNIEKNVSSIGESAFEGCTSLVTMILPDNVKDLGIGVFTNCTALTSISIGTGILYLPWIFEGCSNLSDIRIEDATTSLIFGYTGKRTCSGGGSIQYTKFHYKPYPPMFAEFNLQKVYIGRNITTEAFCYQRTSYSREYYYLPNPPFSGVNINSITIGSYVTNLIMSEIPSHEGGTTFIEGQWDAAFQNCTNLDSIFLHTGATSIPENTFSGCSNVSFVEISNSVKSIGTNAFSGCSSLNYIFADGVTSIGENAFSGCTRLKILSLGKGLQSIGDKAIEGCDSLMEINLKSAVPPTYSTGFSSTNYMSTKLNVPTNVLSIYQETEPWKNFWNLSGNNDLISSFELDGIKYSVINNDDVEVVGNSISEPTELNIRNKIEYYGNNYNVVSISNAAFNNCSYLSSVHIENGITSIGHNAFTNCTNLKVINIPSNLHTIGHSAFYGCSSLDSIILPDSINTIPYFCFTGCDSLDSIIIPPSVTVIGNHAFSGCDNLISVNILGDVTTIDTYAFYNCSKLKNFILPPSITTIGGGAFYNCSAIEELVIPSNVTTIGAYALDGCTGLKELIFEDGETPLSLDSKGIYDGSSNYIKVSGKSLRFMVEYYNSYFSNLPIEKLYIGRNLSNESRYTISDKKYDASTKDYYYIITSYDAPFSNLSRLKELTIGENVDVLGPELEYISEVNHYVTPGSFKKCSSIRTVAVKNPTPPTGVEFADNVYNTAHLIVPKASINEYKEATGWKNFVNLIIETDSIVLDRQAITINVYDEHQLQATIYPENATDTTIIWTSSDETIVKVSSSGYIIGVSAGKASITASCGDVSASCEVEVVIIEPNEVVLDKQTIITTVNSVNQLHATVYPEDATDKTIIWTSSDESVAKVSDSGCVAGISEGKATITASCGDVSASCEVEVVIIEPNEIVLDKQTIITTVNGVCQLYATVYPEDATDKTIIWSSSDETIVKVSDSGYVTGVSVGKATITASCGSVSASCEVEVDVENFIKTQPTAENRLVELNTPEEGVEYQWYQYVEGMIYSEDIVPTSTGDYAWTESNGVWTSGNKGVGQSYSLMTATINVQVGDIVSFDYVVPKGDGSNSGGSQWFELLINGNTSMQTFGGTNGGSRHYEYTINDYVINRYGSTITVGFECVRTNSECATVSNIKHTRPTGFYRGMVEEKIVGATTARLDDSLFVEGSVVYCVATLPNGKTLTSDKISDRTFVLTYVIDGEVYYTDSLKSNDKIVLPEAPVKEGYTFSGWSEFPETMPAEDLTISGTFTVNVYKVYYYVGDELVHTEEVTFGDAIPEYIYEPINEGETFLGWMGETYETMPANDVTYVANIENGIEHLLISDGQLVVYDLSGRKLQVEDLHELSAGTYIVNGRKMVIK